MLAGVNYSLSFACNWFVSILDSMVSSHTNYIAWFIKFFGFSMTRWVLRTQCVSFAALVGFGFNHIALSGFLVLVLWWVILVLFVSGVYCLFCWLWVYWWCYFLLGCGIGSRVVLVSRRSHFSVPHFRGHWFQTSLRHPVAALASVWNLGTRISIFSHGLFGISHLVFYVFVSLICSSLVWF